MKKIFLAIVVFCLLALPVKAEEKREKVCNTDSYGNTSCTDKVTNVNTEELKYNDSVKSVEILNTSMPSFVPMLAAGIVSLGAVSFFLKSKIK